MGKTAKQNRTTFVRCPKNKQYPFNRLPAKMYDLNGYQLAIMAQILSNKDSWNLVKSEIGKRRASQKISSTEHGDHLKTWGILIRPGYKEVGRI